MGKKDVIGLTVPLSGYLTVALILFCIGLYGALTKKNTIMILICVELMLNAVNLNFVAFSKYGINPNIDGQIFTLFTMAVAAAEVAVGIAILIAFYKNRKTIQIQQMNSLKEK